MFVTLVFRAESDHVNVKKWNLSAHVYITKTPIQIYWKFYHQKKNFQKKIEYFLLKTDCGYSLEPPRRGGYN